MTETLSSHSEPVTRIAFSRDNTMVATGSSEGGPRGTGILREIDPRVLVSDVATGHLVAGLDGHHDGVKHIEFGVNRNILFTSNVGGLERRWSLPLPLYDMQYWFHPIGPIE